MKKKGNKYGAKKTVVDGITFDSKKEAQRYRVLLYWQKMGIISDLELQPAYKFYVNDEWQFTYKADFQYYHNEEKRFIVEDVKSVATQKSPVYRLKKRIIEASYSIKITEYI